MFKIGDKLLCKKSFDGWISEITGLPIVKFEEGNFYKIVVIEEINYEKWYRILCKKHSWVFRENKERIWNIWEFFYTQQEMRKFKLKKLLNEKERKNIESKYTRSNR